MIGLLPVLILLPLVAAAALALLRPTDAQTARWTALVVSIATLALSLYATYELMQARPLQTTDPVAPRFELRQTWMTVPRLGDAPDVRLEFYLGIDGVSALLISLTAILTLTAILLSWNSVREERTAYFAWILALESGLIGSFCAFDLLLFYVCFEFTLIPIFFLIGMWGGSERRRAAGRFVLFTLCGSLATLGGILALAAAAADRWNLTTPFSIPDIAAAMAVDPLPYSLQVGLLFAISLGFAVKIPLVPFHTWQPLTYVEAPTAVTVLLSGAILKMGTYGLFRICMPLLPDAVESVGVPVAATLSVVGIIYGALSALAQSDMKRLVAYSSLSHLGFVTLGLFALNLEGTTGGILQMINHGLSTGAIFLFVGMIEQRYGTRDMSHFGGLATRLPVLAVCMIFVCMASVGLPMLNGFVGEYLSLSGMFARHPAYAIVGATGVVLGAWYLLTLIQRIFFGPVREPRPEGASAPDLRPRELAIAIPLMALCLAIGLYPKPLTDLIQPDVHRVVRLYDFSPVTPQVASTETGEGSGGR